jgi:hypothetical protein
LALPSGYFTDYGMEVFISTEVPLHFSAENLLFRDTSDFNYSNLDPANRLESGALVLIGDNYFPFEVKLDMVLLSADSMAMDTLAVNEFLSPGRVNSEGTVVEKVKSSVRYSEIQLRDNVDIEATFNTALLPEKVKLYSESHMDVTLSGDLNLRTGD